MVTGARREVTCDVRASRPTRKPEGIERRASVITEAMCSGDGGDEAWAKGSRKVADGPPTLGYDQRTGGIS